MTASVLNIMVDSLNRYFMKVKMTEFPEVYVMKSYQIQKLRRIEQVFWYIQEYDVENDNFEKCLKHFITDRQFKNIFLQ